MNASQTFFRSPHSNDHPLIGRPCEISYDMEIHRCPENIRKSIRLNKHRHLPSHSRKKKFSIEESFREISRLTNNLKVSPFLNTE